MYDDMYGTYPGRNTMAAAALVFGTISIFSVLVIYIALPAGALAFLFALLSRTDAKMSGKSKAGIICGLLGMILTVTVTVFSVYFVFTNDTARAYLNQYFKYYTGDPDMDIGQELDDLLSSLGISSDFSTEENNAFDVQPDAAEPDSTSDRFSPLPESSDFPNHAQLPESDCLFIPDDLTQEKGAYL